MTRLNDVRVIDVSGRWGAYCTKLLADLGARVTKVEPINGDPERHRPPFKQEGTSPATSLYWAYYEANKRSLALDLEHPAARDIWKRLVASSEVVVSSLPPQRGDPMGIDPATTARTNPSAIFCSITPFGRTGPYRNMRAGDLVLEALGGQLFTRGSADGPPVRIPGQQIIDLASVNAAIAIMAALFNRDEIGGQAIDISVHEVQAAEGDHIQRFAMSGETLTRTAQIQPHTGAWAARDGRATVGALTEEQWASVCAMIGVRERLPGPALTDAIAAFSRTRTKDEVAEEAQSRRLLASPINSLADFFRADQPRARGFFRGVEGPGLGRAEVVGPPYAFSEPLWALRTPAPAAGEHNDHILGGELGFEAAQIESWKSAGVVR